MPAEPIFLDANILIEIILGRSKSATARAIIAEHSGSLCISTLTVHLVIYFGRQITSLTVLELFLTDYHVLDIGQTDVNWAFRNIKNNDFEDALQLAVATRHGCSQFITFDKPLYSTYHNLAAPQIILAK